MDSSRLQRFSPLLRHYAPLLGFVLLNALLFMPGYFCTGAEFFPRMPHADTRPFVLREYVSMLLRRYNQDLFRLSLDLGLMALVLIATANRRGRHVLRRTFVVYYTWLLVFLAYHHGVSSFFERRPSLDEDWRFVLNLSHFLAGVMSPGWFAVCVASLAAIGGAAYLAAVTFRELQLRAAYWSRARRTTIAIVFLTPCISLLAWQGIERDSTAIQLLSKHVVASWQPTEEERARLAELGETNRDRRYDPVLEAKLAHKPNFYLLMVEAYGEILATWDMRDAYLALLGRVQARLERAGYVSATAYSEAPVHSGMSWLSIATVHAGTLINRPMIYRALEIVADRVPSVPRFFDAQGYRTYTLQPGTFDRAGLRRIDMFNHDVVVSRLELDYKGLNYGWGHLPDQWSWGLFRSRWFAKPVEPYYVYYMAVSTHWAFDGIPPYVRDWRVFTHGKTIPPETRDDWPPFPEVEKIGTEIRRGYFKSIEYEWRVLLDVLEADKSPNIVVAVLGDHQPRLETHPPGPVTKNSPLHMLSRDPAFIESLVQSGFTRGLYAEPDPRSRLWHEGLFSLWVSKLIENYGAEGSPTIEHLPRGARLSTLRR